MIRQALRLLRGLRRFDLALRNATSCSGQRSGRRSPTVIRQAHQPWPDMMQFTSYVVTDLTGKTVLSGELVQNSLGQFGIEMSALPKGFYFVKYSGEHINRVVKVVKE